MPAALALLCVYHQDAAKPQTDLFFSYLDYIYKNQPPEKQNWATTDTLLKFAAAASPSIDLVHLKKCIEGEDYSKQVVKNTALGNKLMGHLTTPTIYVNGVKVENNKDDTIDYDKIKAAIENALQK
jgi:protein-disulfide isomerase